MPLHVAQNGAWRPSSRPQVQVMTSSESDAIAVAVEVMAMSRAGWSSGTGWRGRQGVRAAAGRAHVHGKKKGVNMWAWWCEYV